MAQQRGQHVVRMGQRPGHALVIETQPNRQRVDEHAHGTVHPFGAGHPAKQHRAEHRTALPAGGRHQHGPGQMEHAGRADALLAGHGTDTCRQVIGQALVMFIELRAAPLYVQQAERRRRFLHAAQHLPEECLVCGIITCQHRLDHEVAERHDGRQRAASALL